MCKRPVRGIRSSRQSARQSAARQSPAGSATPLWLDDVLLNERPGRRFRAADPLWNENCRQAVGLERKCNGRIEMPRGDKSSYTGKQRRRARHIEEGYERRGVQRGEAERRAWATVNKMTGGGKASGSGRGKSVNKAPARKGGRIGGAAAAARPAAARSAAARKAARTRAGKSDASSAKR